MAIFGKKKENTQAEQADEQTVKDSATVEKSTKKGDEKDVSDKKTFWNDRRGSGNVQNVLVKPRVTEKSALQAAGGVYTFEVAASSGKKEVMKAFNKVYGKTPIRVNIMNNATKKKRTRFGIGTTKNRKKALVFLKKGETIDYV